MTDSTTTPPTEGARLSAEAELEQLGAAWRAWAEQFDTVPPKCVGAFAAGVRAGKAVSQGALDATRAALAALTVACFEDVDGGESTQCALCLMTFPRGGPARHFDGCFFAGATDGRAANAALVAVEVGQGKPVVYPDDVDPPDGRAAGGEQG